MGCCNSHHKPQPGEISEKIRESISNDRPVRLKPLLHLFSSSDKSQTIDSPIISTKGITLNPLGYALWLGSINCFKLLIKDFEASPVEMEKILTDQNITSFDIICERNYVKLFSFYMPIYLKNARKIPISKQETNFTIEFDKSLNSPSINTYTPIQKACDLGNMPIVLTIFNYFKDKKQTPYFLDIEYQNDSTGENCVFIACRNGNYSLLKFLHEVANADFDKKNWKGEGAVTVLLAACKKTPSHIFFQCLVYLIEVVKVDIESNSEEILLLAQDQKIVEYLEKVFSGLGLCTKKQEVEEVNKIRHKPQPKTELEMRLDEDEEDFYVRDYIEELGNERSILSSIRPEESNFDVFASVFGNNSSILK